MGVKVCKFGGSSVADLIQLKKTKEIIESDPERRYVVVSAPGRRFEEDIKITDVLYLCHSHREHKLPYDQLLQVIFDRYMATAANLGLQINLSEEYEVIREKMRTGCNADYIASRGEYLNALIISAYLGYDFVDAAGLVLFNSKGRLMEEETNAAISAGRRIRPICRGRASEKKNSANRHEPKMIRLRLTR